MERAVLTTKWQWLGVHLLGLGAVVVFFVGGLIGQECPPYVVDGSLKTGPFAYGNGAKTEAISLILMGLYALGSIVVLVRSEAVGFLAAIRNSLNVLLVLAILLGAILFGAAQSQLSVLCDDRALWTFAGWFGTAILVAIFVSWPFGGRTRGNVEKPSITAP